MNKKRIMKFAFYVCVVLGAIELGLMGSIKLFILSLVFAVIGNAVIEQKERNR